MKNNYIFINFLVIFSILFIGIFSLNKVNAEEGYVWTLVDQVDFNGNEDVVQQSRSTLYDAQVSYLSGEYSITKTYTGEYNKGIENSPEKGETATAFATFGNAPEIIYPDWPVRLDFSLGFSDRRIINYRGASGDAVASAFFCPPESGPMSGNGGLPSFYDDDRETWFNSGSENGYTTIKKRLEGQIGAGKKGEQVGLCMRHSFGGISVATVYIYEWKKEKEKRIPAKKDYKRYEVPKDKNGDYIDSGVRISETSGEVLVRHGDDPIGWEMLSPGDIIYAGDIVYTEDDSEAIISLHDMTTFRMTEYSQIIMNTEDEKQSKIAMLAGRVLMNVKKMIKDGSMSVEMSQAVAGIKGTIFIAESNSETSSLKVLEGEVEITGKNGDVKLLNAGQAVVATESSLGEIKEFSIGEELDGWNKETKTIIISDIEERTGVKILLEETKNIGVSGSRGDNNSDLEEKGKVKYFFVGFGVLILIFVVLRIIGRKNK